MKNLLLLLTLSIIGSQVYSQNYYTGFDTTEEQDAWTQYRMSSTTVAEWNFAQGQTVSAPYSLSHDYPMGGDVEDWMVSQGFYFTESTASITLNASRFALSSPPEVYYGIWISYGSPDPAAGNFVELADLSTFPAEDNVWHDTTITFSTQNDLGFIAIKYGALDYYWLMITIDDITIENAVPLSSPEIIENHNLIWPNPANDILHIGRDYVSAEILSITGQKIKDLPSINVTSEFDISYLENGIYILRMKKGQTFENFRFVKE